MFRWLGVMSLACSWRLQVDTFFKYVLWNPSLYWQSTWVGELTNAWNCIKHEMSIKNSLLDLGIRLLCDKNLGLGNLLALLVVRSKENMKREVKKSTCDLWWLLTMQLCLQLGMGMGRWGGNHVLRWSPHWRQLLWLLSPVPFWQRTDSVSVHLTEVTSKCAGSIV